MMGDGSPTLSRYDRGTPSMSSLDKAKALSASSEGPDNLAIERNAPARPDTPPKGESNADVPSSTGDAGLHLYRPAPRVQASDVLWLGLRVVVTRGYGV